MPFAVCINDFPDHLFRSFNGQKRRSLCIRETGSALRKLGAGQLVPRRGCLRSLLLRRLFNRHHSRPAAEGCCLRRRWRPSGTAYSSVSAPPAVLLLDVIPPHSPLLQRPGRERQSLAARGDWWFEGTSRLGLDLSCWLGCVIGRCACQECWHQISIAEPLQLPSLPLSTRTPVAHHAPSLKSPFFVRHVPGRALSGDWLGCFSGC